MITRDEEIRLIAYQIWEEEGRPHGKHVEHWAQAERRWNQGHRTAGDGSSPVKTGGAVATAERPGTAAPATAARPAVRRPPRAAAQAPEREKERGQPGPPRPRRQEK